MFHVNNQSNHLEKNVECKMALKWAVTSSQGKPEIMMNHKPRMHTLCFLPFFSNSLIIHAALTQPEHLILVRWMGLETE